MKYYKTYMDRQEMSREGHQKLLELEGKRKTASTDPWVRRGRWGALAACCALVLGLGVWRLAEVPGGSAQDKDPAGTSCVPFAGSSAGGDFEVKGPEGENLMLPMIPYIYYQSVDGQLETDSAPARWMMKGSFERDLTWEEIQRIFWDWGRKNGAEPESAQAADGALPWMLFWEGYTLTGRALYDHNGDLLWVDLWGAREETDSTFTLTLRPGELPVACGLYSDLEATEVFGVPVTGWSREEKGTVVCCSEFMAGDIGVRFENSGGRFGAEYGESAAAVQDGAQMFNSLLVRQGLVSDGGFSLDHLMTAEHVPGWREEEFASLEAARQETAFAPYLPRRGPEGWGEFIGGLTYQEGICNSMFVRWSRGYHDLSMWVDLPESGAKVDTVDVHKPETYDVRRYSIPWADSVPEEVRTVFFEPVFRAEDMSREIVAARAYTVEDAGDSGGGRMDFSVLYPDGTLVRYESKGLSADRLWAMMEPTLP